MEATDRLIDIIQDNAQYENYIIELGRYVKDAGPKPSLIALNSTALEDVMSGIVDIIEELKNKVR